ncbi:MAG: serine protease [Granulosicoccus sp.]
MNRRLFARLLGMVSLLLAGCQSIDVISSRPLFGLDNRQEMIDAEMSACTVGSSVFAVLHSASLQKVSADSWSVLEARTLSDAGWCASQRFARQPAIAKCTAFLISSTRVASAGHCINEPDYPAGPGLNCEDTLLVLDFKLGIDGQTPTAMRSDQVYRCNSVLAGKDSRIGPDWRVVELDRAVPRQPLPVYSGEQLPDAVELQVVGHPHGLPMKAADQGQIISYASGRYRTTLDTFRGNSGSPVYTLVEGSAVVIGLMSGGSSDKEKQTPGQACHEERICDADNVCPGQLATHAQPLAQWAEHRLATLSDAKYLNTVDQCAWCNDPLRSKHWQCPVASTLE